MKPAVKSLLREKRFLWQLLISVFLLVLPVCMIFFNGTRALQGIFWQVPDEVKHMVNPSQLTVDENATIRSKPPEFGIYDPENKFAGKNEFTLEQIYLSWIDIDEEALQKRLA